MKTYSLVQKIVLNATEHLNLSRAKKALLCLLVSHPCSAREISTQMWLCDPRGHIRDLRNRGIQIRDEWVHKQNVDGFVIRFKLYHIDVNNLWQKRL